MLRYPRRTLADWTEDVGPLDDWLATWSGAGWVPEHPWGGVDVKIEGQGVLRWAMVGPCNAPEVG
jgi:hypothetical protein